MHDAMESQLLFVIDGESQGCVHGVVSSLIALVSIRAFKTTLGALQLC